MSDQRLCVILIGGSGAPVAPLPRPDLVVAADAGVHLAATLGLAVDLVVGDFDSADPAVVDRAVAAGAAVERHPVDKDRTDLELALDAAARMGATRTIVAGGAGADRIDHVIANAVVLASPQHAAIAPEWWVDTAVVYPTRGARIVAGEPGDVVSIIPLGGTVRVTTEGLRWELRGDTLPFGTARGVSNRLEGSTALVDVHDGVALVVHVEEAR